jgi:hypothetical protein
MSSHVLVWDIETVPDIKGFAAASGHDGRSKERGDLVPRDRAMCPV